VDKVHEELEEMIGFVDLLLVEGSLSTEEVVDVYKELSSEELGDLEGFGLLVEELLLCDFDVLSD
jgi:hypothetical protein